MEDKQVPWWRRALTFTLCGIRSAFGWLARPQTSKDLPEPPSAVEEGRKVEVEIYTPEDREEETELTENFPEPQDIAVADREAETQPVAETTVVAEVADTPPLIEVAAENAAQAEPEPVSAAGEPEIAEDAEASTASEAETGASDQHLPVETGHATEPESELGSGSKSGAVEEPEATPQLNEAAEQLVEEQVVGEQLDEGQLDEEQPDEEQLVKERSVGEQPTRAVDQAGPLSDGEAEPEPAAATACANEAVDEAASLAESANTGAAAPAFPEPHMDLNHPNREETAEESQPQAAPTEFAQEPSDAAGVAIQKDSSPEAPIPGDAAAPVAQTEVAQEPAEINTAQVEPSKPIEQAAVGQPHAKPFVKLEGRGNDADSSPFSVIVSEVYDGPLDLLLDLIRKQDIDIYDIPIARITAQFLTYVNQLKASDVDVAGEFIYTASLLIHIKSKMLLPRAPAGSDEPAEDPRRELVERLLEHERFKNAAQMLQQKQMLEAATWTNPGIREFHEDVEAEPEIAADTVDLVRVFRDILERARNRPVLNVEEDSVTVSQMIQFLARRLNMEDRPVALRRLLSHTRSERALIAMFLALLELVRLQAILLRQDLAFSEIFIKKNIEFDAVMNDGLANARDDWR